MATAGRGRDLPGSRNWRPALTNTGASADLQRVARTWFFGQTLTATASGTLGAPSGLAAGTATAKVTARGGARAPWLVIRRRPDPPPKLIYWGRGLGIVLRPRALAVGEVEHEDREGRARAALGVPSAACRGAVVESLPLRLIELLEAA